MKLIELIDYLKNPVKLEQLYIVENLNKDSEALEIYMKEFLNLESEIQIFEIEETEDNLVFEKDEVKYVQLFPVDHAIEVINSYLDLAGSEHSNLEIARRLLEYRIKDA